MEITDEIQEELLASGITEQEVSELKTICRPAPDKAQFHKFDKNGNVIGVFDVVILEYLINTAEIFIIGDCPYIYQGGVYKRDSKGNMLKTKIQELLYAAFITARNINNVYNLVMMQESLQKESWEINRFPDHMINFQNGMLDLKTGELNAHSPRYLSINQIPHRYKRMDKEYAKRYSHINNFFKTSLNTPDIKTILQFMGLCMTKNTDYQFFLLLLGEGGNGKSLVITLLENIVGHENISNVGMEELTKQFYPSQLFGKLTNTCADISKVSVTDDSMIKKITGGDRIACEYKGKDAFFFTPYTKLFFSANRFPHVDDKSDGFKRRTRIVSMNRKPEKPDIRLKEKLLYELEYIIYLATQAIMEVFATGEIYESESSKEMKTEIAKKSDSVFAFITECLLPMEGQHIKRSVMFEEYKKYCNYYDRTPLGRNTFFKEMESKNLTAAPDHNGIYIYSNKALKLWQDEENTVFTKD